MYTYKCYAYKRTTCVSFLKHKAEADSEGRQTHVQESKKRKVFKKLYKKIAFLLSMADGC